MAIADASATDGPWTRRDKETLYRRPPARPGATDETGSAWFSPDAADVDADRRILDERRMTTTGEQRVIQIPAEPEFGAATPSGSGRASFGFSAGPISPVRQTSAPPAPAAEPPASATKRKKSEPRQRRHAQADLPVRTHDTPVAGSRPPAVAETPADWPSPAAPETTASWPPPVADTSSSWPPPERIDRADLDRVPVDPPSLVGSTTAERVGWTGSSTGSSTGERRVVHREPPADPYPPKQSRVFTLGIITLSVIVLLAGAIVGAVYFSGSDGKLDSVLELGAGDSSQRTVTAPLDNRSTASFELLAGTNQVRLSIGELGDDLYRISTPEDAGIRPSPQVRNDDVLLQVTRDGDGIGGEVEVVLSAKVRWALRFSGYAEQQILDLTGGQVSGIEMVAGTRRAELTLAQPTGTVPVKINGAVEELVVKSPAANPVRVRVDGGAKTVVAGSRTLKDVPAGSTLTPKNWATQNRYDMSAGARITSLTVETA